MSPAYPEAPVRPEARDLRRRAVIAIDEHGDALLAEGRKVHKLALARSPFPVPPPVVAALRDHAAENGHLPARGLADLRRAVAHYTERGVGIDRTSEDVLIGPGSRALAFLLQLVFDGEIFVPTPAWAAYGPQARLLGRRVRLVPTSRRDSWLLTPEALERVGREGARGARLVVLNYPGNPTGATYKSEQLRELASVAERLGVLLLSDELYGELHHRGQHVSVAHYYPEGTIIGSGLGKWCGAGGWRLGALVFPERLRGLLEAASAAASTIFASTSAPIQRAAIAAYEGGEEIEEHLSRSRRVLSALGRFCARKLRAAGVACVQPAGGFCLFADLEPLRPELEARGIRTGRELASRLLVEAGVALVPGEEFGRPEEELTLRLAYVDFDGARALEAVSVIPSEQPLDATFLRRHCRGVVRGLEALSEWLGEAGGA